MDAIRIGSDARTFPGTTTVPVTPTAGGGFGELLRSAVDNVERLENEAGQAVQAVAAGQEQDLHNTMIALEKADVSFQLLMQVRNKVIAAYETIMRMQV
jgi:flagellar hook-basal body complex protein FliE